MADSAVEFRPGRVAAAVRGSGRRCFAERLLEQLGAAAGLAKKGGLVDLPCRVTPGVEFVAQDRGTGRQPPVRVLNQLVHQTKLLIEPAAFESEGAEQFFTPAARVWRIRTGGGDRRWVSFNFGTAGGRMAYE